MQEKKDPKSAESVTRGKGVESRDQKSDATSSETLSDLEETENMPGATSSEADDVLSPDGMFDQEGGSSGVFDVESGGGGDEDAGPM